MAPALLALSLAACGKGATDSTPPLPLTSVSRVDVQVAGDSVLIGDSVTATVRGVNRLGDVLPLPSVTWASTDTSTGSVSAEGTLRGRNVGSIRLTAQAAGVVGARTIRVVSRGVRVRLVAPDTMELIDAPRLSSEVETLAGERLTEVAPRFATADASIATVEATGVGVATVRPLLPGVTDLLAIVGRDTTRRRVTVRFTPLRSLGVAIGPRVLAIGDSLPLVVAAIDTLGRTVPAAGSIIAFEPSGALVLRNGFLVAVGIGRTVVSAANSGLTARDTLTSQAPSEFPLEIVDGDGQNPLPLRVLLSMERVAIKWRRVIRTAPAGDFVRLQIGECRNAVPVAQFITGVRVLIKLDTLPASTSRASATRSWMT